MAIDEFGNPIMEDPTPAPQPGPNGDPTPAPGADPEPEPKPLKYKSHEEAELAYRDLEKKLGEQGEELGRYRKMVQTFQPQKQVTPQPAETETQAQKLAREAMEKASRIPEDDPKRAEKVGAIWMEHQAELSKSIYQETTREERDRQRAMDYAEQKVKDAGLSNPKLIGFFWDVVTRAPTGVSFDEQIQWGIDQIKTTLQEIKDEEMKRQQADDDTRRQQSVMGPGARRGGPGAARQPGSDGPMTLADAMKASRKSKTYSGPRLQ